MAGRNRRKLRGLGPTWAPLIGHPPVATHEDIWLVLFHAFKLAAWQQHEWNMRPCLMCVRVCVCVCITAGWFHRCVNFFYRCVNEIKVSVTCWPVPVLIAGVDVRGASRTATAGSFTVKLCKKKKRFPFGFLFFSKWWFTDGSRIFRLPAINLMIFELRQGNSPFLCSCVHKYINIWRSILAALHSRPGMSLSWPGKLRNLNIQSGMLTYFKTSGASCTKINLINSFN